MGPPGMSVGSPRIGLHLSPGLLTRAFLGCLGVSRSHEAAHLFALRLPSVTWFMFCLVLCVLPENWDADTHSSGFWGN